MPRIFDNIDLYLAKGLNGTLQKSYRADFCVGYFNLRGWDALSENVQAFAGEENCCRLMVGMQKLEDELLRESLNQLVDESVDNAKANALKKEIAAQFRKQLTFGIPSNQDERTLQLLKQQLIGGQLKVKLFLRHTLHAKLYLAYKEDGDAPIVGYVGSSNLTMSGLSKQGELNVDVVETDAAEKLSKWFAERWEDRWCIDISKELIEILNESWAGEVVYTPYQVYLKIAYHLSQEARHGLNDYMVPLNLQSKLLPYQSEAVGIAARHLEKRGGVLIGDVVGLGKTLTATALAKTWEELHVTETLVICPKNLVGMWDHHLHKYQVRGKVNSISKVTKKWLESTPPYRVVIIDESHNLRNKQTKRYAIVKEYLERTGSKVILLTATPYNKEYADVAGQLRLFIDESQDIGIMPDQLIAEYGNAADFEAKFQYSPNTLQAFERSPYKDDWQQLLKSYMVRRTRTFIKANYAEFDILKKRHFLRFLDGSVSYFPDRTPKKVEYSFDESDPTDQYVRLYSDDVVKQINSLHVARYGLGNYIDKKKQAEASSDEARILSNLSKAGKRLMGFCRTNLFKRLESSGFSFLISLSRHAVRNYTFLHAIDNRLEFPIGPHESADADEFYAESEDPALVGIMQISNDAAKLKALALKQYEECTSDSNKDKYDWIASGLFTDALKKHLQEDIVKICALIELAKDWKPADDKQLNALQKLICETHASEKVLVFTQFADTANYLYEQLEKRSVQEMAVVTGAMEDPTEFAKRFSPRSNEAKNVHSELRVLISTDVLSEGQNLQDAHIIVNYDLPWALIRLIQRAGRVDRIGQLADEILCYSFWPQDGLEKIIKLRKRLTQRIKENSEAIGSDETFFDGDPVNVENLYNEKSGILNDEEGDVDITSEAYEIWNQATKDNKELKKLIEKMPDVINTSKERSAEMVEGDSAVTYHRNSNGFEVLTWMDRKKKVITHNQSRILKALRCDVNEPAIPRMDEHHELVKQSVEIAEAEAQKSGGHLGSEKSARYKTYKLLDRYYKQVQKTLWDTEPLKRTIQDIYDYPLRETARDLLNKRLRLGIADEELADLCMRLRDEGKLSTITNKDDVHTKAPHIICSMGIHSPTS